MCSFSKISASICALCERNNPAISTKNISQMTRFCVRLGYRESLSLMQNSKKWQAPINVYLNDFSNSHKKVCLQHWTRLANQSIQSTCVELINQWQPILYLAFCQQTVNLNALHSLGISVWLCRKQIRPYVGFLQDDITYNTMLIVCSYRNFISIIIFLCIQDKESLTEYVMVAVHSLRGNSEVY